MLDSGRFSYLVSEFEWSKILNKAPASKSYEIIFESHMTIEQTHVGTIWKDSSEAGHIIHTL